jgi:hypothetical protein
VGTGKSITFIYSVEGWILDQQAGGAKKDNLKKTWASYKIFNLSLNPSSYLNKKPN